MIPPQCLTTCDNDEEDNTRVAMILGGDRAPICGNKPSLMAPKIKLSSGCDMPVLGFGTANLRGYQCSTAIHCAVETGFRHFDTAYNHENEKEVGEALRTQIQMGNVSRENLFVTTKLWNTHHHPRDVRRICEKQLQTLGFSYIDLYLMHFPVGYEHLCDEILKPIEDDKVKTSNIDYIDTWRAMEELVRSGLVRNIGLSNFNMEQIQRIIQCSSSKPVVNQVEIWPGHMQKDLVDYCRYNGIVVSAFAPLGQPDRETHMPIYFFSEGMRRLSRKYHKSAAQIVLRYLIDYGVVPIPKAANPLHIKQNLDIFDFQLDDDDTHALRGLTARERLVKYEDDKDHPFYPFKQDEEEEMAAERQRTRRRSPSKAKKREPQRQKTSPPPKQQAQAQEQEQEQDQEQEAEQEQEEQQNE